MLRHFLNLLYPPLCAACEELLVEGEKALCLNCEISLPRTRFAGTQGNKVEKLFWGRLPLQSVTSCYYFQKGSRVQHLVHEIKYKGNKDAADIAGRLLGRELRESGRYSGIDMLVPVPLHPSKERKRGFNQSERLARGMAAEMSVPVVVQNLVRTRKSISQTKKNREKRLANVRGAFDVRSPEEFSHKHILLVDDVLTTGATLEACAEILFSACPEIKLSMATLAVAAN